MRMFTPVTGKTYHVTRPDGTETRFIVDEIRGNWLFGRMGAYVGSIRRDNVRGVKDPIGPFFTFQELRT